MLCNLIKTKQNKKRVQKSSHLQNNRHKILLLPYQKKQLPVQRKSNHYYLFIIIIIINDFLNILSNSFNICILM